MYKKGFKAITTSSEKQENRDFHNLENNKTKITEFLKVYRLIPANIKLLFKFLIKEFTCSKIVFFLLINFILHQLNLWKINHLKKTKNKKSRRKNPSKKIMKKIMPKLNCFKINCNRSDKIMKISPKILFCNCQINRQKKNLESIKIQEE